MKWKFAEMEGTKEPLRYIGCGKKVFWRKLQYFITKIFHDYSQGLSALILNNIWNYVNFVKNEKRKYKVYTSFAIRQLAKHRIRLKLSPTKTSISQNIRKNLDSFT